MSRRMPSTSSTRPSLMRAPSIASLAMPPPSKIPNRPPSALSTSGTSTNLGKMAEGSGDGRLNSPTKGRKTMIVQPNGTLAKSKTDGTNENGEINIQVVVRCRGRSPMEINQASPIITSTNGPLSRAITVETTPLATASLASLTTPSAYGGSHQPLSKTYAFDRVFGPEADQTMVYKEVVEGMLDEVLAGYNCTIFAYGQTGTGKTYTMQGDLSLTPLANPTTEAGIIPRVLHRLFALLDSSPNTEYSVKCSYVELYNEELRDLLTSDFHNPVSAGNAQPMALSANGGGGGGGLKIYEDQTKRGGVMIQGLEEAVVRNLKEGLALLLKGSQRRQVAETKMNSESSRSHSILTLTVHVKEPSHAGGEDLLKVGKFNLVDLAGSEAIGRSGAENKRAREAGMINQSLLTLGRVISALVEKGSHVPYRESKLTRLLQDSLGGRTKTCIVATVSPTRSNMEETLSTLDYAIRAKSIRNKPEVNQHLTKTGLLKEYLGDIERLKAELLATREKNGIYIPEEEWKSMHEQQTKQKSDYEEAKHRANAITVELATKKVEFDELTTQMLATAEELEQVREAERALNALLEEVKLELEVARKELEEEVEVSKAYQNGEERLDRVAGGLKTVAVNSVKDVGGLFEKIARKSAVLGSNTNNATKFGTDLKSLSNELQQGLESLHSVQGDFGRDQLKVLEDYAQRGRVESKHDMAVLEASLKTFNDHAKTLAKSVEKGKLEMNEASSSLLSAKDEIQVSVREWAKGVSERSTRMVEELLGHQSEHLSVVGSVLGSTADLVDAVISTAREHIAAEAESSARTNRLATETAHAEITRLRAQNALLANLLTQEQSKSQKLRQELVGNFTKMMEAFTAAQDESLRAAVGEVVNGNETSIEGMEGFRSEFENVERERQNRAGGFTEELQVGYETCMKQREAGQGALREVTDGMRERLSGYAQQTTEEAEKHVEVVDGFCEQMATSAANVSSKATSRAQKQANSLSSISHHVHETHQTSVKRTSALSDGIQTVSSALLSSHASTSKTFTQTYENSRNILSSMSDSTDKFLQAGIQEDVSTGTTPRKKVWEVTTSWERTGPRQAIIAGLRKRREMEIINGAETHLEDHNEKVPEVAKDIIESTEGNESPVDHSFLVQSRENSRESTPVLTAVSLNSSQIRQPGVGKIGKVGKKTGMVEEKERPVMAVLGEGGMNIPRRVRR